MRTEELVTIWGDTEGLSRICRRHGYLPKLSQESSSRKPLKLFHVDTQILGGGWKKNNRLLVERQEKG